MTMSNDGELKVVFSGDRNDRSGVAVSLRKHLDDFIEKMFAMPPARQLKFDGSLAVRALQSNTESGPKTEPVGDQSEGPTPAWGRLPSMPVTTVDHIVLMRPGRHSGFEFTKKFLSNFNFIPERNIIIFEKGENSPAGLLEDSRIIGTLLNAEWSEAHGAVIGRIHVMPYGGCGRKFLSAIHDDRRDAIEFEWCMRVSFVRGSVVEHIPKPDIYCLFATIK